MSNKPGTEVQGIEELQEERAAIKKQYLVGIHPIESKKLIDDFNKKLSSLNIKQVARIEKKELGEWDEEKAKADVIEILDTFKQEFIYKLTKQSTEDLQDEISAAIDPEKWLDEKQVATIQKKVVNLVKNATDKYNISSDDSLKNFPGLTADDKENAKFSENDTANVTLQIFTAAIQTLANHPKVIMQENIAPEQTMGPPPPVPSRLGRSTKFEKSEKPAIPAVPAKPAAGWPQRKHTSSTPSRQSPKADAVLSHPNPPSRALPKLPPKESAETPPKHNDSPSKK